MLLKVAQALPSKAGLGKVLAALGRVLATRRFFILRLLVMGVKGEEPPMTPIIQIR